MGNCYSSINVSKLIADVSKLIVFYLNNKYFYNVELCFQNSVTRAHLMPFVAFAILIVNLIFLDSSNKKMQKQQSITTNFLKLI